MVDFGYDISDYETIQPEYGTMADFEALVDQCNELGIKLILDFVPNHTSDKHDWFQRSINGDDEYKDFYIWHPGKVDSETGAPIPPNNWISVFRNSAWEWNEKRQAYYLHQFTIQQPDLNYRNPKVVEKMNNVIRFWLARGIAGFRIDAVTSLFENMDANGNFPDEPLSGACDDAADHCYLNHIHTENLDESFEMVYQWRHIMDKYKRLNGGATRILMTEAFSDELSRYIQFYGNGTTNGANIPFNFELLFRTNGSSSASDYKNVIDTWLNAMPNGVQANWVVSIVLWIFFCRQATCIQIVTFFFSWEIMTAIVLVRDWVCTKSI